MTKLGTALVALAFLGCADDPDEQDLELEVGNATIDIIGPGKVDFGTRKVGTLTSATVTLANHSTVSFQCDLITSNNPAFKLSSTWIHELAPGQSMSLAITFAPAKVGTYSGVVSIIGPGHEVLAQLAVLGAAQ